MYGSPPSGGTHSYIGRAGTWYAVAGAVAATGALAAGAADLETTTIEIDDAYVPESWTAAVQQAHGHLRPGTTAVTVTGTRRRSGVWNGESTESSHPVAFTVFVACEPSFDRCHVLRLSQLDNPLR